MDGNVGVIPVGQSNGQPVLFGPLVRLRQLAALACGLIRFDPDVRVEAADWVRVEGGANTPVQVDGEMLCALPVEISLHPQRLQLIPQWCD